MVTDCAESDLDKIIEKWHVNLEELNKAADGIRCSIAVGAAFGFGKYKIDDVIKLANEHMYTDRQKMKARLTMDSVRSEP